MKVVGNHEPEQDEVNDNLENKVIELKVGGVEGVFVENSASIFNSDDENRNVATAGLVKLNL